MHRAYNNDLKILDALVRGKDFSKEALNMSFEDRHESLARLFEGGYITGMRKVATLDFKPSYAEEYVKITQKGLNLRDQLITEQSKENN